MHFIRKLQLIKRRDGKGWFAVTNQLQKIIKNNNKIEKCIDIQAALRFKLVLHQQERSGRRMASRSLIELDRDFILSKFASFESGAPMRKTFPQIPPQEIAPLAATTPSAAIPAQALLAGKVDKKKRALARASDVIFYMAIVAILAIAMFSSSGGAPKTVMGFSCLSVLSSSMQDEIPMGALILVRKTNPQNLAIGDNITYMRGQNNSVTHKIVDIVEGSGASKAFVTKGVNNVNPDKEVVHGANVVGKVVLCVPAAGAAISIFKANIFLVAVMFGLCMIISFCLRGLSFRKGGGQIGQLE